MSASHRMHAAKVAAKREIKSTLHGMGLYAAMFLIFIGSLFFFVNSSINHVLNEGILSLRNLITQPFFIAIGLAATYLGLCSALAISRERDQGTLEVLFYGPVDAVSYIASKYVHQLLAFVVILVFATLNFYVISIMTNLGFSAGFFSMLVLSIFLTSSMVSFGIFLSVSTKRMMVSVIMFLALVLFFFAFSIAHSVVMNMGGRDLPTLVVYVRVILDNMNAVMEWISPFAYFQRGMMAVFRSDTTQYLVSLFSSAVYSLVLFGLSVWVFQKKGVRR